MSKEFIQALQKDIEYLNSYLREDMYYDESIKLNRKRTDREKVELLSDIITDMNAIIYFKHCK